MGRLGFTDVATDRRSWPWSEGTPVRCSIWRGGTSRALLFRRDDLPDEPSLRDRVILAAMGSPDARQIDGLGGAHPLTSKVAIVSAERSKQADVLFTFGQVALDRPFIDYSGTCGNISAAVGAWAVDEGVIPAREPITTVRVLNTNTDRPYLAHVPVRQTRPAVRGDFRLDGVPNPGACLRLEFLRPEGAVTGALLPTGRVMDSISVLGRTVRVSILDVGNPIALVPVEEISLSADRLSEAIASDGLVRALLVAIRERAGAMLGLADEEGRVPSHIPKVAVVAPSGEYRTLDGRVVDDRATDLRAWALTMGRLHQAYPVTAAMPTAVALHLEGSVVHGMRSGSVSETVRIGHPSGVLELEAAVRRMGDGPRVDRVVVPRTARKIMEGEVLLP